MLKYVLRNRRLLQVVVIGLFVSPLFGVIGADLVGYHEPLDVAAEALHLKEMEFNWTPFSDYTVPGVPDAIGYIIAGIIGISVIFAVGYILAKTAEK
ncbi:cobalamin biosynthesis protein [Ignicoccus islandicus DSM 13165]|uniref:Cobalamin biosynthesis protein n=1 Tax=Ignicoccus islandicus DSM 13165 TaxID=940295 RepID=A0A0U3F1F5_9CREN|nr:PDGLE domain-containing protein [Ignicoccus islandicus]ALU11381.1 cobalamin biosynthesis protein [Ignicoccus islandicus DSM 13165]